MGDDPLIAMVASVAAIRQSVDDFHKAQFPAYCQAMEKRLANFERKNDEAHYTIIAAQGVTNGKVRAFELWQARLGGAMMLVKNQWQVFLGLIGGGGLAGAIYWLLTTVTGHT